MQVLNYFVKTNPKHLFTLAETFADGVQLFGRLDGKASEHAKLISSLANLGQKFFDVPTGLTSQIDFLKKLFGTHQSPWVLVVTDAVYYGSWFTDMISKHFGSNLTRYTAPVGLAAEFINSSYDLFLNDQQSFLAQRCKKSFLLSLSLLSISTYCTGANNRYLNLFCTTGYLVSCVAEDCFNPQKK